MNILEINQKNLSLLDVSQLTAFLNIFKGVSNPKAKKIVKDLARELSTRKTEEVEEASIKDIIKSVKASSKKIGGIINKVMDDAEFQKAYAKYVDNPNDKNRLKKIQDYTNGMIGDMFESPRLKEERLKKVCSIVLGEDFDETFIYEDMDFTKPSVIKEAYKKFIKENRAIVYNPRMIRAFIKKAEKKFPKYKGEIQQIEKDEIVFPNDEKLRDFFRGAKEVKFVLRDSVEIEEAKKDFKPHMMYDPKTGKGYKANTHADHLKMKDMGYTHEKPTDIGEAVKFWTVTITKKAGKLFKGQTVDVKARNSAEAIKKGIKQMKGNPALVPGDSVDAVLGESNN